MSSTSLLRMQRYSLDWVKDFYDQGCLWWGGQEADEDNWYEDRATAVERLCGPNKRVLDLGPGAAEISGRIADRGHTVVGVEISPVRVRYAQAQVNRPRATGSLTIVQGDFYRSNWRAALTWCATGAALASAPTPTSGGCCAARRTSGWRPAAAS